MFGNHHGRGKSRDGGKQARRGLAGVLNKKLIHDNDGRH